MRASARRWARLLVGVAATLVCSWLAFRHVDWSASARVLGDASPLWLLTAVGLLALGYALRIVRWWLMLRSMARDLPLRACPGPFLSSMALNNVLPFRAGDVMRAVGFSRRLNVSPSQVLGTLVFERLFDLTALLMLFFLGFAGLSSGRFPEAFAHTIYAVSAACALLVLLALFAPGQVERLARHVAVSCSKRDCTFGERLAGHAAQFFASMVLMRSPVLVGQLLVLSVGAWVFEGAMFAAVAHAIGMSGAGLGTWFALATGTLGTLIPSTPGYVGTFDYFTMLGLMAYGAPETVAALFALAVHVVLWVPVTLVGLVWLLLFKAGVPRRREAPAPVGVST